VELVSVAGLPLNGLFDEMPVHRLDHSRVKPGLLRQSANPIDDRLDTGGESNGPSPCFLSCSLKDIIGALCQQIDEQGIVSINLMTNFLHRIAMNRLGYDRWFQNRLKEMKFLR